MKKEQFITRRVIESTVYNVFEVAGEALNKLGEIEVKGKVSQKDLQSQFNTTNQIITTVKEQKKAKYVVPVDKFMEIAVKLEDNDEEGSDNE